MKHTFYVLSGEIREIVVAPTPVSAVRAALMRASEKLLQPALITVCNKEGFGVRAGADMLFITENELRAMRFNVQAFLGSFIKTEEEWRGYRKLKESLEAFNGLLDEDDLTEGAT